MVSWIFRGFASLYRTAIAMLRGTTSEVGEHLDTRRIIAGMWPILGAGFGLSMAVCGGHWARGAMWCLACLSVGAAIGFLFGIPKVFQREGKAPVGGPPETGVPYRQRVNTNLEEISDWLTKIIVGVGLIELRKLPGVIDNAGLVFAESIEEPLTEHGVLAAIIVFFLVGGFLFGYLITRLYLQGALGRADRAAAYPDEGGIPKQTVQPSQHPQEPSRTPEQRLADGNVADEGPKDIHR